jgi:hypothetical protein
MTVLDLVKLFALMRQLAADVKARVGLAVVLRDVLAVIDLFGQTAHEVLPESGSVGAHHPFLTAGRVSSDGCAAEIEGEVADLERLRAVQDQGGQKLGAFGDGALWQRLKPLLIKAIIAAFTGL